MKKDLISIIVPMYNSEKTINKCIDSLMNQTYDNIEVILIDDGSTDNTYKICKEYSKKENRIKLYSQKNSGVSCARNFGLKNAKGDYIAFVDSDDYVEVNMYEKLLQCIKNSGSKLAICNYFYEKDDGEEIKDFGNLSDEFDSMELPGKMYNNLGINGYVWNKLYSRDIIYLNNSFIKFDEKIGMLEDNLYNYNVIFNNKIFKCIYTNQKFYHYVQFDSSVCNRKYTLKKLQYFVVREKQIEMLDNKKINSDFLKNDYIFNFSKDKAKISLLKLEKNDSYIQLEKKVSEYSKSIDFKNLSNRSKIKYIIGKYFPSFQKVIVKIKKENI